MNLSMRQIIGTHLDACAAGKRNGRESREDAENRERKKKKKRFFSLPAEDATDTRPILVGSTVCGYHLR